MHIAYIFTALKLFYHLVVEMMRFNIFDYLNGYGGVDDLIVWFFTFFDL